MSRRKMTFATAPAHVRAAIRAAAERWETTEGVPLTDLLPADDTNDGDIEDVTA